MKKAKNRKTTSATRLLHQRYIKGNKKRLESLQKERENLGIAEEIYRLRTQAQLSQKDLAKRIGTTQSVISRLEDADYSGHSLKMLRKVAAVLDSRVEVRLVPASAAYVYP